MAIKTLRGKDILLRALELTDLDFLYQVENNESVWEVSNTVAPYSQFILKQYLENSYKDIYEAKQLRLVICNTENNEPIGLIDFFDFDPKHNRVGVGILILLDKERKKGYALEALQLLCNYAFTHLNLHQVYANISEDNLASIKLFEKKGFVKTGVKVDWIYSQGNYKNEFHYQFINNVH